MSRPRSIPAPAVSEASFQTQVLELARICGWQSMHVRRAMGRRNGAAAWQTPTSIKGWPDAAIWRPGRFLLVEFKSEKGPVRPEQVEVIGSLRAAGVDVRVWRPSDWPEIQRVLTEAARGR